MKMFNKVLASLFLVSLMAAGATACEQPVPESSESSSSNSEVVTPPTYTFSLTADKTTATAGEKVTLTAILLADGEEVEAEGVKYEIIEGSAYATLKGNVLTISSSAKANAVIKVWAKLGATKSDIVEIKVDVPLEGISASANNVTNVDSGSMVILNKTFTPENADVSAFEWVILEGATVCTITNDILTVNAGVATGTTIKVQGQLGDMTTEILTFTVGYPVETVNVSVNLTENMVCGESVVLQKEILPAKADQSDFEWITVAGEGAFTLNGDVLTIKDGVATGTIIKLKGKAGGVLSESEITISVGFPVESVEISADVENIESGASITLSKEILPAKANKNGFNWVIVEGNDVCSISGDKLTVKENVATGTQIKVQGTIEGMTSNTLTFTVGYPVKTISISANGITNILSGDTITLFKSFDPINADTTDFEWDIVEGSDICSIVGDKLTVNAGVATGEKITVQAKVGDKVSTPITFTVGYPVQTLTVTLSGSANIPQGGFVDLVVTPNPTNATNAAYTWAFNKGGEFCTIDENNRLTVSEYTPLGTEIEFYADGVVDSNVVTVVVDVAITYLEIASNAPANLVKGESYNIALTAEPTNASTKFVEWVVNDEAKDYVTVVNGVMTIAENAPTGLEVTVKATSGAVESNPLSYTVGIVLNSISVKMVGATNVDPTDMRVLNVSLDPSNATDQDYGWAFEEGEGACTIVNNVLTVNADAEIGTKITFYAYIGSITSEPITITVGTPIESIVVSADKEGIVRGSFATLSATINPTNATNSYTWEITEGADHVASFDGNVLVVKDAVESINGVIKVKAVSSTAESEELTFRVLPKQEDIDKDYLITASENEITLDKYSTKAAPTLTAEIYYQGNLVTDKELTYKIVDGDEYLGVSVNNGVCTFTAIGHGLAVVEIGIKGTTASVTTVDINVIVPPESLDLPDVFTGLRGGNYAYSFSKIDKLSFAATSDAANVCKDVAYTFTAEDGTTGDEVATYADGKITFKKMGKITVTATSVSGSEKEATISYNFNINDGVNVSTFEEFQDYAESRRYDGTTPINFVVMDKTDNEYKIVPQVVKEGKESYNTLSRDGLASLWIYGKGLYVNGNHHPIDVSDMRALSKAEMDDGHEANGVTEENYFIGSLINIFPHVNTTALLDVKLYDFEIKGNAPVDFGGELQSNAKPIGVHISGINIGSTWIVYDKLNPNKIAEDYTLTKYTVDMKNISVSGFTHGLNMTHVVSGKIDTVKASNCYIDGIVCRASIMTLKDITLGSCGASGMELAPENFSKAGINSNEVQTITFEGTFDGADNWHKGDTTYFKNYKVAGMLDIPTIIGDTVASLNDIQRSHIQNNNDYFCFVSLQFHDVLTQTPNMSITQYNGENGIADINTITSTNTTAQYIRVPIVSTAFGQLGIALFANVNYQG